MLLGNAQDPVKALPWVWLGPGQYKAILNNRFYVTARTNPTISDPPTFIVYDNTSLNTMGNTYLPALFRERLAQGVFNDVQQQPINQNQQNVTVQQPVTDPRNVNNGSGEGSSSPGSGLFGMSNSTLLFIGLAIIAVIYFIKNKK